VSTRHYGVPKASVQIRARGRRVKNRRTLASVEPQGTPAKRSTFARAALPVSLLVIAARKTKVLLFGRAPRGRAMKPALRDRRRRPVPAAGCLTSALGGPYHATNVARIGVSQVRTIPSR